MFIVHCKLVLLAADLQRLYINCIYVSDSKDKTASRICKHIRKIITTSQHKLQLETCYETRTQLFLAVYFVLTVCTCSKVSALSQHPWSRNCPHWMKLTLKMLCSLHLYCIRTAWSIMALWCTYIGHSVILAIEGQIASHFLGINSHQAATMSPNYLSTTRLFFFHIKFSGKMWWANSWRKAVESSASVLVNEMCNRIVIQHTVACLKHYLCHKILHGFDSSLSAENGLLMH